MLVSKDSEGGAAGFYWEHADDVLDIPEELAFVLLRSHHLGFHAIDPVVQAEKPKIRQKLAPKDENPIGGLKEAVQVATGQ